jgi:protein arginine N-methyltransferase 5
MDSSNTAGDVLPIFYVGQHETKRALPVTDELVHHAQDLGVRVPYYQSDFR